MRYTLMILLTVWILLVVNTFAKGTEIGIVTTTGNPTCEQAQKDLDTAKSRWSQVGSLRAVMKDSSMQLVLTEEMQAIAKLGGRIIMWQNENCKSH